MFISFPSFEAAVRIQNDDSISTPNGSNWEDCENTIRKVGM